MMSNKLTDSFEDVFEKFDKDPEFRKAERKIKPYYDLVVAITKRRFELGLTQKELAQKAKTHQSRISRIEAAEDDFRLSTLIRIAEALDTEVVIQLIPNQFVDVSGKEEIYQYLFKQVYDPRGVQNFSEGEVERFEPVIG